MNADSMEIINRNLGKGGWLEISNRDDLGNEKVDKLWVEQLPATYIGKIMNLLATFQKSSMNEDEFIEYLAEHKVDAVNELLRATMKVSYPELQDDAIEKFVMANWMPLLIVMMKINSLGSDKMPNKDMEAIKRAKHLESLRKKDEINRQAQPKSVDPVA